MVRISRPRRVVAPVAVAVVGALVALLIATSPAQSSVAASPGQDTPTTTIFTSSTGEIDPGRIAYVTSSGDVVTASVSVARRAPVLGISWVVRSMAVAPREAVPP